ncbi:MAG: hypothetical protein ACK5KT_06085 [Dysgonomonas sp.]
MKSNLKIALVGSYGNGKTITTLSLCKILGLPRAHVENIDSLYQRIYGSYKNPKEYSTAELLSLGLARFHSRIKGESPNGFISDGSVFNEIAYGEARFELSSQSENRTVKDILHRNIYMDYRKRLYRTITDYGKTAYDKIFYLRIAPASPTVSSTNLKFQECFEKNVFQIFQDNNIRYKTLTGNIESFISEILKELYIDLPDNPELKQIIIETSKEKQTLKEDFHYGK